MKHLRDKIADEIEATIVANLDRDYMGEGRESCSRNTVEVLLKDILNLVRGVKL